MRLCMKCLQIYDSHKIGDGKCPKNHCIGNVVEIDELMIPVIIKLKIMGYETKFCCQGHIDDVDNLMDTYILFTEESFARLFKNNKYPPNGWVYSNGNSLRPLEVERNGRYLDANRDHSNELLLQKFKIKFDYITKLMNDLYLWLENLH